MQGAVAPCGVAAFCYECFPPVTAIACQIGFIDLPFGDIRWVNGSARGSSCHNRRPRGKWRGVLGGDQMGSGAATGDGQSSNPDAASDAALQPKKSVRVGNAGLVLLAPYLPVLFDRTGLLVRPDTQIEPTDIPRALRLLDYLVYGQAQPSDPGLELSRILCGIPFSQPVAASADLSEGDAGLCDGLIAAAISNWTALGKISPAGLRETFLQRHGELRQYDDRVELAVERKAFDVLLDQVPWSFAIIKHCWMPERLKVVW